MTWSSTPNTSRHLGLDLGVTNIKWAIVERDAGSWEILDKGQVPTEVDGRPESVIPQLIDLARARGEGAQSIGIGVPGLYDPELGISVRLANLPGGWLDVPIAGPVEAALDAPTFLINDARAFGLAELRLGAGRGARTMVGLTLGTGVGGVVAIDGQVHQGHKGSAGEIGHMVIEPDGPLCNCGCRGCLEAFTRAEQIARACDTPTVEEAVGAARAGDERAARGLREAGRYLGIAIANLIVVLTPERVVIGGGVAAAADVIVPAMRDEIRRRVHVTELEWVEIVTAELGTFAGAIGAAVHGAERAGEHADEQLVGVA